MTSEFEVNGIPIAVTFKAVRNLRLKVDRDGKAKLTAPQSLPESRIREFLQDRQEWLERAVAAMKKRREVETSMMQHQFITGETFVFFGRSYMLFLDEQSDVTQVEEKEGLLVVHSQSPLSKPEIRRLLNAWVSKRFTALVRALLDKWMDKMNEPPLSEIRYRSMKSRWGSMQPVRRVLCLNTKLVFYPESCIEMVIVHELCHLKEASHNARFHALMLHYLPDYMRQNHILRDFFREGLDG